MTRGRDLDLALVVAGVALAGLLAVLGAPAVLRIPLGILAALVLPGYAASMALFPPGELRGVERAALAICLSVALIIVIAPVLEASGAGVSATALVAAMTVTSFVAVAIAWWRRRGSAPGASGSSAALPGLRDPGRRGRLGLLALGLAGVALSGAFAASIFNPATRSTAFFLVQPSPSGDGAASATVVPGASTSVALGITNHEGAAGDFRIVVESAAGPVGGRDAITIPSGSTWTGDVEFTAPDEARPDVEILLFRGTESTPYRTLRLQLDASAEVEPSGP